MAFLLSSVGGCRPLRSGLLRLAPLLATIGLLAAPGPAAGQEAPATAQPFAVWLEDFRAEARSRGFTEQTLAAALGTVQPIPRVLELDARQPEFVNTFWRYHDNVITEDRVRTGREMLARHAALFDRLSATYGVQPRFLVAFWGLETNFGSIMGDYPVIPALATLAHDSRRSDFFRAQMFAALTMIQDYGVSPSRMVGSWAGAMGHMQFLPTTFLDHAVDGDGDGRIDIWGSIPDAMTSAAAYLSALGWDDTYTWGREVSLNAGFPWQDGELTVVRPLAAWQALGVRRTDGSNLPAVDIEASVLLPMGHRGPAFLVYDNYRRILDWNRSILYAIAVGHLSDRLQGAGPLQGPRPDLGPRLRVAEVEEMQTLLNARGFDSGEPDGRVGPATRGALRSFQQSIGVPADGYPTGDLLAMLRRTPVGIAN